MKRGMRIPAFNRLPVLVTVALLSGCATAGGAGGGRPTTVFPPSTETQVQQGTQTGGQVWIQGHLVQQHPGCYPVDRGNGAGIIRCNEGQLEWLKTQDIAGAVDDFDQLKDAMVWDAQHNGEKVQDQELTCTMVGTPATCHAYVYTPHDGGPTRSTIVGMCQLEGAGLVAQCATKAGQADTMKPVCGEIFEIK